MATHHIPSLKAIEPFKGTAIDLITNFDVTVLTVARYFVSALPLLILFDISTDEERDENELEFDGLVLPQEPAPLPDNEDRPVIIQRHKRAEDKYNLFLAARSAFIILFMDHIPLDVRDYVSVVRSITFSELPSVREMRIHLFATYNRLTMADLDKMHKQLEVPFLPGMDMREHIANLNKGFNALDRANEGLSLYQRYRLLSNSMLTHPDYRVFVHDHSNHVANPTYQSLSQALTERSHHMEAIAAAAIAHAPVAATAAPSTAPQLQHPHSYCYTHGYGFHDGKQCVKPGDGHKKDAKKPDADGGSTRRARPRHVN